MRRTCHFVQDIKRRRTLYLTLVRSQFEHCSPIWRPSNDTAMKKFESFQKRCVKWILSEEEHSYNSETYYANCRTLKILPIRVVATTPRKDPQPNISDLQDHSQSIFRPILTRIQKKKKKKLPPLYIDQLKCGIRPPTPESRPPPDPPDAFWGTTL